MFTSSDKSAHRSAVDLSCLQALMACALPGATLMVLFKGLQVSALVPSTFLSLLAVLLPELLLQATLLGLLFLGFCLIPARLRPLLGVLVLSFFSLQMLSGLLDTASVYLRYTPLSWIELRQFAANPVQLWPVVRSVLSPALLGLGILAVLGTSGLLWFQWSQTRAALATAPRPFCISSVNTLLSFAAPLVAVLAMQGQVEPHLKSVRTPIILRLTTAMLQDVRGENPLPPVISTVPLHVDHEGSRSPFNVLIFVLESTSRAATSLAGSATTPTLARLALEGYEAPQAYTVQTHTSKALVGIHCGQPSYPQFTGLESTGVLLDRCLPELLSEGGYRTGFFQAPDLAFEARSSLARSLGFQHVEGGFEVDTTGFVKVNYLGYEDRVILEPALRWAGQSSQPWMMTVLTGTSHHPYITPELLSSGADLSAMDEHLMYAQSLRYTDALLHGLLEGLKQQGNLENTLVVVVGDHGEAFGQHGLKHHDYVPYEEGVQVPLVLWGPGVLPPRADATQARTIPGLRQQLDLMPTVLDLLGWKLTQGQLPGQSLLSSSGHAQLWFSCVSANECMGMREGSRKILQRTWDSDVEVYDLSNDPTERENLAMTLSAQERQTLQRQLQLRKFQIEAQYIGRAAQLTRPDPSNPTPRAIAMGTREAE